MYLFIYYCRCWLALWRTVRRQRGRGRKVTPGPPRARPSRSFPGGERAGSHGVRRALTFPWPDPARGENPPDSSGKRWVWTRISPHPALFRPPLRKENWKLLLLRCRLGNPGPETHQGFVCLGFSPSPVCAAPLPLPFTLQISQSPRLPSLLDRKRILLLWFMNPSNGKNFPCCFSEKEGGPSERNLRNRDTQNVCERQREVTEGKVIVEERMSPVLRRLYTRSSVENKFQLFIKTGP